MWGVKTHNYDPKISTYLTTTTQNLPEVLLSSPYQQKRQENWPHFLHTLWRFWATSVQLMSSEDRILTRYLNVSTFSRNWSHEKNSALAATWAAVVYIWW